MADQTQQPPGGAPPGGAPPGGYPPGGYPPGGYPPGGQGAGYQHPQGPGAVQGAPQQGYPYQQGAGGGAGYAPYGAGPGYGVPRRSSIPKVMGILMLVFGGIGLLSGLSGLISGGAGMGMGSSHSPIPMAAMEKLRDFQRLGSFVGLPLALLQCLAGLWAIRYKRAARLLSSAYAVLAMLWVVVSIAMMYSWLLPTMKRLVPSSSIGQLEAFVGFTMVVAAVIGMVWPALILILMNRRSVREACIN